MPNGGPDCCFNCIYNPKGDACNLRDLKIEDAYWTYCDNFLHVGYGREQDLATTIKGPVFSIGLYEGYVRLPWFGDKMPRAQYPVRCFDCGDFVEVGIYLDLENGEKFGFCCNRNYLRWWSEHTMTDVGWAPNLEDYDDCPKISGKAVNAFVVKD